MVDRMVDVMVDVACAVDRMVDRMVDCMVDRMCQMGLPPGREHCFAGIQDARLPGST